MTKNITFTLPAVALEGASEAFLLGDFNNWNSDRAPKLEKQKDGSYKTVAKLEEGKTYEYRFLLNDGRWVNDYNAQSYTNKEGLQIDNCVITVPVSENEAPKKAQPAKVSKAAPKEATPKVEKKTSVAAAKPASKETAKATATKPTQKTATKSTATAAKTAPVKATAPKVEKIAKPAAKKAATKAKK